jgi:hypothetical protein
MIKDESGELKEHLHFKLRKNLRGRSHCERKVNSNQVFTLHDTRTRAS